MTASPSSDPQQKPPRSRLPLLFIIFSLTGFGMAALVMFINTTPSPTDDGSRPARIPSNGANAAVGWQVPDFDMETLDGEIVNITDYRGKIVFLNFWATWCVPCQKEMPIFEDFMADPPDDVVILAVNNGEVEPNIRDFVELLALEHLPIIVDPQFALADGFGVMNLPITYVIDGEGIVRHFKLGEINAEDLETYITDVRTLATS